MIYLDNTFWSMDRIKDTIMSKVEMVESPIGNWFFDWFKGPFEWIKTMVNKFSTIVTVISLVILVFILFPVLEIGLLIWKVGFRIVSLMVRSISSLRDRLRYSAPRGQTANRIRRYLRHAP